MTQRWREGRDSYRPAREPIDPSKYGVEPLAEREAKAFVLRHHYSGSYPAARVRYGLFRLRQFWAPELVGVCVLGVPAQQRTLPHYAPGAADGVVLSRFVLLDDVEANGETWFLRRVFRDLRLNHKGLEAVISYSDPVKRTRADGFVVLPGHVGTIYQAFNGRYLGRSSAETLQLAPDGRVISRRALSKIRNDERGAAYAYRQLVEMGAPTRLPLEEGDAYVKRALSCFRKIRHPGNHVYGWSLCGRDDIAPTAGPYPKLIDPT